MIAAYFAFLFVGNVGDQLANTLGGLQEASRVADTMWGEGRRLYDLYYNLRRPTGKYYSPHSAIDRGFNGFRAIGKQTGTEHPDVEWRLPPVENIGYTCAPTGSSPTGSSPATAVQGVAAAAGSGSDTCAAVDEPAAKKRKRGVAATEARYQCSECGSHSPTRRTSSRCREARRRKLLPHRPPQCTRLSMRVPLSARAVWTGPPLLLCLALSWSSSCCREAPHRELLPPRAPQCVRLSVHTPRGWDPLFLSCLALSFESFRALSCMMASNPPLSPLISGASQVAFCPSRMDFIRMVRRDAKS